MKEKNVKQVRRELNTRGVAFDLTDSWTKLLTKLKEHEEDQKYFKPVTAYDAFVWTELNNYNHKKVSKVQYSR